MHLTQKSIFLLLIGLALQATAAPKVTATIDAKQVLVQESFTWTVDVEGSDEMPQVRLPQIKKLAILSGPNQSSNYTYVNGKMSSKKSLSYTFVALEPGLIAIPAVEVRLGNKRHLTNTLRVTVIAPRDAAKSGTKTSQSVFLRAIPSKTSVFVGEPLTVKYKLFTKVGVYNYSVDKLPDAVGFWAEEMSQSKQPRLVSEVINGERYNTATLKTVLYYPTRSGELVIDALRTDLEIEVKSKQRTTRRFNDPFFNDPFFSGKRRANKNFYSNPVNITVKSLPEPRPANFSGAVGKFQIRAGLDTNAVFANDAVGLSITLTGSGNFKAVQLPEPLLPEGIDIFKPERAESISIKNKQHTGRKQATYLLVPRTSGKVQIDPIEFTYFDLSSQRYITRSSGDINLTVYDADGNQPVVTSGYSREEVELMQDDIRYIKAADSQFSKTEITAFTLQFWLVHIIGIVVLVAVFAWEYRSQQLEGNADLRRRSNALTKARKQLKQAEKLSEDSEELRALLNQCITGFIGARLNAAENTLDIPEFVTILTEHKVEQEVVTETAQFLEGLAMDRFAPGAVKRTAQEWISATQQLLQTLRRSI